MDRIVAIGHHVGEDLGGPSVLERHLACLSVSGFHRVAYDDRPGPPGAPTCT